jgi:hypothetical protein
VADVPDYEVDARSPKTLICFTAEDAEDKLEGTDFLQTRMASSLALISLRFNIIEPQSCRVPDL